MSELVAGLSGLRGHIVVRPDPDAVAGAAAALLRRESEVACAKNGRFAIALSGGSTPVRLFERLGQEPFLSGIDWPAWSVYFSDERAVSPDDAASNYRLVRESLLTRVAINPERVRRMPAELADLDLAADEYAVTLHGDLEDGPGGAPRLDCVVLGLGENGHTASLFPGTPALSVSNRWVTRGLADYAPNERLTLTYPTINAASLVMFLVTGAGKAAALRATAAGTTPAARVHPADGQLVWIVDEAAAGG